jgi:hypothetical protein
MPVTFMSRSLLSWTAECGTPDEFCRYLVAVLRQGPLEANVAEWLATFVENGGDERLELIVKYKKVGKPKRRSFLLEKPAIVTSGKYLPFRVIADECRTKEEAIDRARRELNIGRKNAEHCWKEHKADAAKEAENPVLAELYADLKRLSLKERGDRDE